MTDKEIIKANSLIEKLEDAYNTYYDTSRGMPYDLDKTLRGSKFFIKNAINESNRQKAEIENLKTENQILSQKRFNIFERIEYTDKIKAEAVKEFAERLLFVDGINNHTFDDCASILVPEEYKKGRYEKTMEIRQTIDNLLKETVGDAE